MKSIESLLQPFFGYVELGMHEEALAELDNLPKEIQAHPLVQIARMDYFIETGNWEDGVCWGESLCELWPEESEFWIKRAYCLHELKRTSEAKEVLISAPAVHRELAIYCYNMACYETQLGNLVHAQELLERCFVKDPRYRESSQDDPDLKPLWNSLKSDK